MKAENLILRFFLSFLLLAQLADLAAAWPAQRERQLFIKDAGRITARAEFDPSKFNVECKERFFLGELPTITLSMTNTSRSAQSVKEAEYQKFSLEMTGMFQNDAGQHTKSAVYDGSWDLPKEPVKRQTKPGETILFEEPRKREPKVVKLEPGESTNLTLDLFKTFGGFLGVSRYKLTVKSEDGQKVTKEFEVYFDVEKSVPVLAKMLTSDADDVSERNWAVLHLAKFNRPKLVVLLEELVKSGTERQRDFASGMLAATKSGWFDPLKLKLEMKDRFSLGENPTIGISIQNGSSTPRTVSEAASQKFFLELVKLSDNQSQAETKSCVYDRSQVDPKPAAQKSRQVRLAELESTSLSLDLSECFKSRLSAGKYELRVRAADGQENLKDQTAVRKFEIYPR